LRAERGNWYLSRYIDHLLSSIPAVVAVIFQDPTLGCKRGKGMIK
jgi:hypothetical protein